MVADAPIIRAAARRTWPGITHVAPVVLPRVLLGRQIEVPQDQERILIKPSHRALSEAGTSRRHASRILDGVVRVKDP